MKTTLKQAFGATFEIEDNHMVITNVFPVNWDWDGYRFSGYCRPTRQEIIAAGFDPDAEE